MVRKISIIVICAAAIIVILQMNINGVNKIAGILACVVAGLFTAVNMQKTEDHEEDGQ